MEKKKTHSPFSHTHKTKRKIFKTMDEVRKYIDQRDAEDWDDEEDEALWYEDDQIEEKLKLRFEEANKRVKAEFEEERREFPEYLKRQIKSQVG